MCWRMPTFAVTTSCRRRWPRSQAIAAKRSNAACVPAQSLPTTTAIGNCAGRRSGGSSTSRAPSPSTWNRRPSPPRASGCACPMERCSVSQTNRCMAKSSCPAPLTHSTSAPSPSIFRLASRRSACCRVRTIPCTHVSLGASMSRPSGENLADHHHRSADVHPTIEVDRIHVAHADAARGDVPPDFRRLVGAVDADECVSVVLEEIERAGAERIVPPTFEGPVLLIDLELRPALHNRSRRHPGRPFLHRSDLGAAGPSHILGAACDPVLDRLAMGQNVIEIVVGGVDDYGARLLGRLILDNAAAGGNRPLVRFRKRHHLLFPRAQRA